MILETIAYAVCLIGLLHGVFLIWLLYQRRAFNPVGIAHLLLGLASMWFVVVEESVVASGLWRDFPHILRFTTWMPFLLGPSVWLFCRSLVDPDFRRHDVLHCAPAFLALLYFLPFYFQTGEAKIAFVMGTSQVPVISSIMGTGKIISVFAYLIAGILWLRRNSEVARSDLSIWMQRSLAAFLIVLVPLVALFALEHRWSGLPVSSDLIGAVYLASAMYVLCLLVLTKWPAFAAGSQVQKAQSIGRNKSEEGEVEADALLDYQTAQDLFDQVTNQVKQHELYKTPGISIRDLSELVGVAHHYLSYIVNTCSGGNFSTWLNGLRVAKAKELLLAKPDMTVLEAGLEAGFNSKAAFNRIFKEVTGQSPSAFRKAQLSQ